MWQFMKGVSLKYFRVFFTLLRVLVRVFWSKEDPAGDSCREPDLKFAVLFVERENRPSDVLEVVMIARVWHGAVPAVRNQMST